MRVIEGPWRGAYVQAGSCNNCWSDEIAVFICSLVCRIRPEKRAQFLTSMQDLIERTRWLPGCFGCRLVAELGEPGAVTMLAEWADRESLDQFIRSTEYRIMLGMRILMEEEPRVSVDQVVTRTHVPTREG